MSFSEIQVGDKYYMFGGRKIRVNKMHGTSIYYSSYNGGRSISSKTNIKYFKSLIEGVISLVPLPSTPPSLNAPTAIPTTIPIEPVIPTVIPTAIPIEPVIPAVIPTAIPIEITSKDFRNAEVYYTGEPKTWLKKLIRWIKKFLRL